MLSLKKLENVMESRRKKLEARRHRMHTRSKEHGGHSSKHGPSSAHGRHRSRGSPSRSPVRSLSTPPRAGAGRATGGASAVEEARGEGRSPRAVEEKRVLSTVRFAEVEAEGEGHEEKEKSKEKSKGGDKGEESEATTEDEASAASKAEQLRVNKTRAALLQLRHVRPTVRPYRPPPRIPHNRIVMPPPPPCMLESRV